MAVLTVKAMRQPGRLIVDVQGPGPGRTGPSWTARASYVGKVKVHYGVYSIEDDLAGVSVGWVRNRYAGSWNIRTAAVNQLNMVGVADTAILQPGDVLEFVVPRP